MKLVVAATLIAGIASEEVRAQTSRLDASGNVLEDSHIRIPRAVAGQQ